MKFVSRKTYDRKTAEDAAAVYQANHPTRIVLVCVLRDAYNKLYYQAATETRPSGYYEYRAHGRRACRRPAKRNDAPVTHIATE